MGVCCLVCMQHPLHSGFCQTSSCWTWVRFGMMEVCCLVCMQHPLHSGFACPLMQQQLPPPHAPQPHQTHGHATRAREYMVGAGKSRREKAYSYTRIAPHAANFPCMCRGQRPAKVACVQAEGLYTGKFAFANLHLQICLGLPHP